MTTSDDAAPDPAGGGDRRARPGAWRIRGGVIPLDRPVVVGILNVTPDSFSDGGIHLDPTAAEERAHTMVAEGADLVDVGGESTRPGAPAVRAEEEWRRIGPVLGRLEGVLAAPVSVDTTKAEIAARALDAGAAVLNDVSGLWADPELGRLAAETGAGLVLMHMRGDPRTMQLDVEYEDLIGEVRDSLAESVAAAVDAGCSLEQLVVDPGIGFGKSAEGSLRLLAELSELRSLGRPVMVGPSRKSFIRKTLESSDADRTEGTIAACIVALERGARLFRVHDVGAVRRALDLAEAARRAARPGAAREVDEEGTVKEAGGVNEATDGPGMRRSVDAPPGNRSGPTRRRVTTAER